MADGGPCPWGLAARVPTVARLVRFARRAAVALASMGLLFPSSLLLAAAGPKDPASRRGDARAERLPQSGRPSIRDVRLDDTGTLHGIVLSATGLPLGDVEVSAFWHDRLVTRRVTDATGRFHMAGLRGGVWRLKGGNADRLFRVWAVGTAPPAARGEALLRTERSIVRGQNRQGYRLTTDGVLLGAVLLGGAAVPVIIDRGGSDPPSGS